MMLDTSVLNPIAVQLIGSDEAEVEGKRLPVRRTSGRGVRVLAVTTGGRQFAAIERNPSERAPGGQLARVAIRSSRSRTSSRQQVHGGCDETRGKEGKKHREPGLGS